MGSGSSKTDQPNAETAPAAEEDAVDNYDELYLDQQEEKLGQCLPCDISAV